MRRSYTLAPTSRSFACLPPYLLQGGRVSSLWCLLMATPTLRRTRLSVHGLGEAAVQGGEAWSSTEHQYSHITPKSHSPCRWVPPLRG